MAAQDIGAEVLGWAHDEISKQCLGEDFGVAVGWAPVPAQTPQGGIQMVPMWHLEITARNPLLGGGGALFHCVALADPKAVDKHVRPSQELVRKAVADGLRKLRVLARSKTAGANGHGHAVPAGGG